MNAKKIAAQFAAQNTAKGKAGNVYFEGNVIYSYGQHYPIAVITGERTAMINSDKYSVSTSRQVSIVRNALIAAGYTLENSDTVSLKSAI